MGAAAGPAGGSGSGRLQRRKESRLDWAGLVQMRCFMGATNANTHGMHLDASEGGKTSPFENFSSACGSRCNWQAITSLT